MSLEHIVKHTCRFNIKNPQHRKVNEVLAGLSPDVCKSKSQFLIDAAEYYIDHFGKEAFVTVSRDEQEYVTRTELENLKRQKLHPIFHEPGWILRKRKKNRRMMIRFQIMH